MEINREKLPRYLIPTFIGWVVVSNLAAILIAVILYLTKIELYGKNPGFILGVVITINVVSIFMLAPLFWMEDVKPFLWPAVGWFIVVSVIYIVLGLYWLLIPAGFQFGADLWFHWIFDKTQKSLNKK